MSKEADKNYVSMWFWLLTMIVMAIPFVNLVMIFVWAFVGENDSRKNYFRALLMVFVLTLALAALLLVAGLLPAILNAIHDAKL